jgi:2-haloacid dehalogenase
MKRQYTFLLFDADDTLFDYKKAERNALQAACREIRFDMNDAILETYSGIDRHYWKKYEDGEISLATVQEQRFDDLLAQYGYEYRISGKQLNRIYQSELSRQTHLNPGAEEICKILYPIYSLYIITNGVAETQRSRISKSSISNYISDIFTSEESGYQKPSPQFFTKVFERINIYDPKKYLIIGDSLYSDILGGLAMGIDCVWYNPNKLGRPESLVPTYTIDSLFDILAILDLPYQ